MLITEKLEAVRNYIASKPDHESDRWGNIKYKQNGCEYRFKFMTNVFRKERCVEYGNGSKSWVRVKTYNISNAYDNLRSKNLI